MDPPPVILLFVVGLRQTVRKLSNQLFPRHFEFELDWQVQRLEVIILVLSGGSAFTCKFIDQIVGPEGIFIKVMSFLLLFLYTSLHHY